MKDATRKVTLEDVYPYLEPDDAEFIRSLERHKGEFIVTTSPNYAIMGLCNVCAGDEESFERYFNLRTSLPDNWDVSPEEWKLMKV